MCPRPRLEGALWLFSVAGLAWAQPQTAGGPARIGVWFALKEPVAAFALRDQAAGFQTQVTTDLRTRLNTALQGYWDLEAARSAGETPRLDIFLEKNGDQWGVVMMLATEAAPQGPWRASLYRPGDLDLCCNGGLPGESILQQDIEKRFDELLQGSRDPILTALKTSVPLGKEVVLLGPPAPGADAFAVLPLHWGARWATASYKLLCQWPQHGTVFLYSTGVCEPSDYTPQRKQYDAVKVRHDYFELRGRGREPIAQHVNDLDRLQPLAFFLEDATPAPDCTGQGPLVAPQ